MNSNNYQNQEWNPASAQMSLFRNPITNKRPEAKPVTLAEVYEYVVHRQDVKAETEALRAIVDENEQREFKNSHFDYITPSGTFEYHQDSALLEHSGVLCMDIDDVGYRLEELFDQLLHDPYFDTLLMFRSLRGKGLKWFIPIDLERFDHKTWFNGVRNYLIIKYKLTEKQVDKSCVNVSRACYLGYDENAYLNVEMVNNEKSLRETLFNPIEWMEASTVKTSTNTVSDHPFISCQAQGTVQNDPLTELEKAKAVSGRLIQMGANIAESYDDYLRLGFALADGLGIYGRDIYHQLCSQSSKYLFCDCEKKWQECLSKHDSRVTIATFYAMAKDAGVDLSEISRQFPSNTSNPHLLTEQYETEPQDIYDGCELIDNRPHSPLFQANNHQNMVFPWGAEECEGTEGKVVSEEEEATPEPIEDRYFSNTFSDNIQPNDLPVLMREVVETQEDAEGKDKMMLAALTLWSGCIPGVRGIYSSRWVYPPNYTIINAPSGAMKGVLADCVNLVKPVSDEIHSEQEEMMMNYERQLAYYEALTPQERLREDKPRQPSFKMLVIPANSSATAFYQQLNDNGGSGIMFESEADTLAKAMKQDWGDFSDGLRKAFHHETISYSRRQDNERVYLENPRLAVLLTCTPGQVKMLFGNNEVENGSANRNLFYCLKGRNDWVSPFAHKGQPLSETLEGIGKRFLELYHDLLQYQDDPIEFTLTPEQENRFDGYFEKLLPEQVRLVDNKEFSAFIYRLGITTFRIAMTLTVLRSYERIPRFEPESRVLVCNNRDFQTALTIVDCLVSHTAFVYTNLLSHNQTVQNPAVIQMNNQELLFYSNLPKAFTKKEAEEMAKQLGITSKSAERYLGNLVNKHRVVKRVRQGYYEKC